MAMEATELRIFSEISAGQNIGSGSSSLLKTRGTEIKQDVANWRLKPSGNTAFHLFRYAKFGQYAGCWS